MAMRSAENGDTEMLRVDADAFIKVYSCSVFESCRPLQFQPGDQRLYVETNKDADLTALELLDPQTGKTELVESDPLGKVDFSGALFSEATDELVETWYIAARVKTYYKSKAFGDDVHWIEDERWTWAVLFLRTPRVRIRSSPACRWGWATTQPSATSMYRPRR